MHDRTAQGENPTDEGDDEAARTETGGGKEPVAGSPDLSCHRLTLYSILRYHVNPHVLHAVTRRGGRRTDPSRRLDPSATRRMGRAVASAERLAVATRTQTQPVCEVGN